MPQHQGAKGGGQREERQVEWDKGAHDMIEKPALDTTAFVAQRVGTKATYLNMPEEEYAKAMRAKGFTPGSDRASGSEAVLGAFDAKHAELVLTMALQTPDVAANQLLNDVRKAVLPRVVARHSPL